MVNEKDVKPMRRNNKWIIILLVIIIFVLISIISIFVYDKKQEEVLENIKYYSEIDNSFYLQNGKLFIIDSNDKSIQVPGDYSQMKI